MEDRSLISILLALFLRWTPSQSFQSNSFSTNIRRQHLSHSSQLQAVAPFGNANGGRKGRRKRNNKSRTGTRTSYNSSYTALKKKNNGVRQDQDEHEQHEMITQTETMKKESLDRYRWLYEATLNLLDNEVYPPGSLCKGKWHELNSMLVAWSKWMSCSNVNVNVGVASNDSSSVYGFTDSTQFPLLMESILKRIIDERSAGTSDVQVTTQMYNVILEAWLASIPTTTATSTSTVPPRGTHENSKSTAAGTSRRAKDGAMCIVAAQRSLDIVKQMQSEYEAQGNEHIKPNLSSFITVLKMWTRACSATSIPPVQKDVSMHLASRKAHQTLQWMEYLARSGRNVDVKPNVSSITLVMGAFAKSGEKDAGSKAEALLRHMQEMNVQPNLYCYNMVIHAYTRQGRRGGAVDNAERILHELEDLYEESGNLSMKPDVISYTSLVTAWANSNRHGYGANRAEQILNRMMEASCQPNTITFNAVLKTWSRSGDRNASERALHIFQRMEEEHQRGNIDVKPDRITYNTLIHTLAKSARIDAMNHAERILALMESEEAKGNDRLSPNLFSYNTIIEGWSKVRDRDGATRAYALLQKVISAERDGKDIYPDSFSFNNVIFALSRSGLKSSALRAEELLQYMEAEYQSGNMRLKPDVFGYSAAIHAWARTADKEAGLRAEALLHQMEERYAAGEEMLKPNSGKNGACQIPLKSVLMPARLPANY